MNTLRQISSWDSLNADLTEGTRIICDTLRKKKYTDAETGKSGHSLEDVVAADLLKEKKYVIAKLNENTSPYIKFVPTYIPLVKYIDKIDVIVFAIYAIDLRPVKVDSGENGLYECFRLYVDREKNIYIKNREKLEDNPIITTAYGIREIASQKELKPFAEYLREIDRKTKLYIDRDMRGNFLSHTLYPFKRLFGDVLPYGPWKYYFIGEHSDIEGAYNFLKASEPSPISGKRAALLNSLDKKHEFEKIEYSASLAYGRAGTSNFAFIERVDEEWTSIRLMHNSNKAKYMYEIARIYVSKKETIACRFNFKGEKINLRIEKPDTSWRCQLVHFNKDSVENTRLEYVFDTTRELYDEDRFYFLVSFLNNWWLEKIANSELWPIMKFTTSRAHMALKTAFDYYNDFFGGINIAANKSVNHLLGLNRHQRVVFAGIAKRIMSLGKMHCFEPMFKMVKALFNNDMEEGCFLLKPNSSIVHIDNETFDMAFSLVNNAARSYDSSHLSDMASAVECFLSIKYMKGIDVAINSIPKIIRSVGKSMYVERYSIKEKDKITKLENKLVILSEYLHSVAILNKEPYLSYVFSLCEDERIAFLRDAVLIDELSVKGRIGCAFKEYVEEKERLLSEMSHLLDYEDTETIIEAPQHYYEILDVERTLKCSPIVREIKNVFSKKVSIAFVKKRSFPDSVCYVLVINNETKHIEKVTGYGGLSAERALWANKRLSESIKTWAKEMGFIFY